MQMMFESPPPPPPSYPITLGRSAWLALKPHMYPHEWDVVEQRLSTTGADDYGRITMEFGEHLYLQISLAIVDALMDHEETEGTN